MLIRSPVNKLAGRTLFFIIVGFIGFCIEYSIISCCIFLIGADPISSRLVSFPTAVLITWILNRKFTYQVKKPANMSELIRYARVTLFSQAVNVITYTALCWPSSGHSAFLGLVVATAISSTVSIALYGSYAFCGDDKPIR